MLSVNEPTPRPAAGDIIDLSCLDLKYPISFPVLELTPREFCRRVHGLDGLPEVECLQAEIDPAYRKRCIRILSRVLNISSQTIRNWGPGLDFPKMPTNYRRILGLFWKNLEMTGEIKRLRRFTS